MIMAMKLPKPKLSPRMQIFLDQGIAGLPFWDICCDHGYIGIGALKSDKFSEVHFVDQVPHIMDRLEKLFLQSPHLKPHYRYFFHRLPGEAIEVEIFGSFLVAGVGGATATSILKSLLERKNLKAHRLLISPHMDEKILLTFTTEKIFKVQYQFIEKIEIEEAGRVRPLYIFDLIAK